MKTVDLRYLDDLLLNIAPDRGYEVFVDLDKDEYILYDVHNRRLLQLKNVERVEGLKSLLITRLNVGGDEIYRLFFNQN